MPGRTDSSTKIADRTRQHDASSARVQPARHQIVYTERTSPGQPTRTVPAAEASSNLGIERGPHRSQVIDEVRLGRNDVDLHAERLTGRGRPSLLAYLAASWSTSKHSSSASGTETQYRRPSARRWAALAASWAARVPRHRHTGFLLWSGSGNDLTTLARAHRSSLSLVGLPTSPGGFGLTAAGHQASMFGGTANGIWSNHSLLTSVTSGEMWNAAAVIFSAVGFFIPTFTNLVPPGMTR